MFYCLGPALSEAVGNLGSYEPKLTNYTAGNVTHLHPPQLWTKLSSQSLDQVEWSSFTRL